MKTYTQREVIAEDKKKRKWEQQWSPWGTGGNYIYDVEDDCVISFQPNRKQNGGFGLSIFDADTDDGETALIFYRTNEEDETLFLILNGDFRKEYEQLAEQGANACLAFYNEHRHEHGSSWTTGSDIETFIKRRLERLLVKDIVNGVEVE